MCVCARARESVFVRACVRVYVWRTWSLYMDKFLIIDASQKSYTRLVEGGEAKLSKLVV